MTRPSLRSRTYRHRPAGRSWSPQGSCDSQPCPRAHWTPRGYTRAWHPPGQARSRAGLAPRGPRRSPRPPRGRAARRTQRAGASQRGPRHRSSRRRGRLPRHPPSRGHRGQGGRGQATRPPQDPRRSGAPRRTRCRWGCCAWAPGQGADLGSPRPRSCRACRSRAGERPRAEGRQARPSRGRDGPGPGPRHRAARPARRGPRRYRP